MTDLQQANAVIRKLLRAMAHGRPSDPSDTQWDKATTVAENYLATTNRGIKVITKRGASVLISERALQVARNMAMGKDYKRLSHEVIAELDANGLHVQTAHVRGEGRWYYPLHPDQFKSTLSRIGAIK